jgi:spermidine synthase
MFTKQQLMSSNKLIYQTSDNFGPIQIFEDGITRSLHFGSRSRQSSMLLLDPTILVLSYTRAIQTSLIFQRYPQNILLIGQGGGSLAKFYLKHFPDCQLDVVELRQKVVDVSQRFFHVPQANPRLHFYIADASQFLRQNDTKKYDLIVVDAFTEQGLAESVHHSDFFQNCRAQLTDSGMLCINIWTNHETSYRALLHQLAQYFPKTSIFQIPVRERGNSILMATPEEQLPCDEEIEQKARILYQYFGLEFHTFIKDMYRPLLEQMIIS